MGSFPEAQAARRRMSRPGRAVGLRLQATVAVAALALVLAPMALADRTQLKPGWNMFSPQQDVQLGQQVARDAELQLPIMNERKIQNYINDLGRRLAERASGAKYPYTFKVVNDKAINAFALPGGPVYINRGVIEAADNEAQLAGVMAHEISHVALRHGTNQATKQYAAQVPLAILGGVLGSNSVGSVLAQLGAGFAANSILLKYSRDAERQADVLGTQILYDAGYDPRAMAQFFEKIEAESKGGRMPEFFSSHPNPENRYERTVQEVQLLGGPPKGYKGDSAAFRDIHSYILGRPEAKKGSGGGSAGSARPSSPPPAPASRMRTFENADLRMAYPENWKYYGGGSAVTFAPEGGILDDGRGNTPLAYGMIVNLEEENGRNWRSVEEATSDLIRGLQQSNPAMRVTQRNPAVRVDGRRALSYILENDSPVGGKENVWLVSVLRDSALQYFVCVAPANEFPTYQPAFEKMIGSARLVN